MKFDVVIGNPPYNDGIYKDFIDIAKSLKSINSFFIPAAFLVDTKMDSFNDYIDDIVIYQKTFDIWKHVQVYSGICYYVYNQDTGIKKEKTIVNIRKGIENKMNRPLCYTIQNEIYRIDTLWKDKDKYYFDIYPRKYNVMTANFASGGVLKNSIRMSVITLTDKPEKYKDVCTIDEQLKQYIIKNTGKKRNDMVYRIDIDDENIIDYFKENTRR